MPALMQDLPIGIGQKSGRRGAETRAQFQPVERRLVERAEAWIAPAFRRAVGQPPAQLAALEVLVVPRRCEAVEALNRLAEAGGIDARACWQVPGSCRRAPPMTAHRSRSA